MTTTHWTLSVNVREDRDKIELLCNKGKLRRVTAILGRPVCWEYEMESLDSETGETVLIEAWIGTGTKGGN